MKKTFFTIIFTCLSFVVFAGNITTSDISKAEQNSNFKITSDVRHFNPMTGIYDLNGHVYVKFPTHGEYLIIKADSAQFKLYNQEVTAKNNINLEFGDLIFKCDNVFTPIRERTAYVNGNILFTHKDKKITADSAVYNWKTKLATFKNASLNGKTKRANLTYNVLTGTITS